MKKNLAFNKINWSEDGKFFLLQDKNNFIIGNPLISNPENKLEENEEEQEPDFEEESMERNNNNYNNQSNNNENYNSESNINENYNNYMEGRKYNTDEEDFHLDNREKNDHYDLINNRNRNLSKKNDRIGYSEGNTDKNDDQYEDQYNKGNDDENNY